MVLRTTVNLKIISLLLEIIIKIRILITERMMISITEVVIKIIIITVIKMTYKAISTETLT